MKSAYALDSTTIDLCLSLFPWAHFRQTKGGIKLHTLQDLRGNIPSVVKVTPAKIHDVNIMDQLVYEPGAFYVMDRGYLDYRRIKAFFGTSDNAVKTQIWIAISTYLLVAIVKKELNITDGIHTILQLLSLSLFEKKPIQSLFEELIPSDAEACMQKQFCLSLS